MEDILLDDNGNFVVAADGDAETVVDLECLLQDVKHRLLTFPGDLWQHRDYGIGVQAFLHQEDTELNRLYLEQVIRLGVAQDDQVDSESIKVSITSRTRDQVTVGVTFRPTATAFENDYGEIPEDEAAIVLTISQEGITFGDGAT
jgi:hypothetical protein